MLPLPRAASGCRGGGEGGGGLWQGRVRKGAPGAMLVGMWLVVPEERPWAELVPWRAGRKAQLGVKGCGGGLPCTFLHPPFLTHVCMVPYSIITWTSRVRRAGGPGG